MIRFLTLALATSTFAIAPALAQDDATGQSGSGGDAQSMASSADAPSDASGAQTITMTGPDNSDRGRVSITSTPHGVLFEAEIEGVEPGMHGFHVHETGLCEDDFTSAGGHYNPSDAEHGFLSENGPHAGDMVNFTADADGTATFSVHNDLLRVSGGEAPLDDADGSALMVHSGADDYTSQPSGDAGDRVACGVIAAGQG